MTKSKKKVPDGKMLTDIAGLMEQAGKPSLHVGDSINTSKDEATLWKFRELSLLLSLSEDMATIRNKENLFTVIWEKIRPIVGFDDAVVSIYSKDYTTYKHLVTAAPPERKKDPMFEQIVNVSLPVADNPDEFILQQIKNNDLVRWDTSNILKQYPSHFIGPFLKENNLLYNIYQKISWGGNIIGFLNFHFSNEENIKESKYGLYKAIAGQLAAAVANILANEDIVEREQEKTKLLSISEAICKINKRSELLNVIYKNIQHVFPFDSAGLFITSEEKNVMYEIQDSEAFTDELHTKLTAENRLGPWPLSNSNPSSWWMKQELVINSMEAEAALTIKHTGEEQFKALVAYGLKHLIGMPMYANGKKIGAICFCSKQADFYNAANISMFKNISEQISVAVANIIANEEILERETEKTILLSISESIATIRDKKDLLKLVFEKVRPLFNFYDTGFFVFDKKCSVIEDWSVIIDKVSPSEINIKLKEIEAGTMPYDTPVMCWALNELHIAKGPIVFSYTDDLINRFPDYPQFQTLREFGIKESLSAVLRNDKKDFGILFFNSKIKGHFKQEQFKLFQSIADQLAVAVANILADEEIAEREKTKSLQIEIGKALAEEGGWTKRLLRCATLLQKEIPYTLLLPTIMMNDNHFITYGFYLTGRNKYQVLEQDDLQRIVGTKGEEFYNHWRELSKEISAPFVYSATDERNILTKHPIRKKLMEHFRLGHSMVYPIMLSKFKMVHFLFYTNTNQPYVESHINFMNNIQNYTSICFDRVLAYDELEKFSKKIEQENKYLQEEIKSEYNFDSIIGNSRILKEVFSNVRLVATVDTTVLILGETGTGKELIARSLHNSSQRNKNTFIKINCAALPAQLIESELFGHEKGSFTGAFEKRIGKFELADGGSIFLDEIGELPLELQAKLLRVLQEKEFERIGGSKIIKCDVRIIAATNRVLEKEVEKGRFRADLYYRLNVFPIYLPPLRERKEDIPLLATYFAQKFCKKMNRAFKGINIKMLEALTQYNWPGNIRELENVMEQAVIVNQGSDGLELARQLLFVKQPIEENTTLYINKTPDAKTIINVKKQKETMEIQAIRDALQKTKGRIRGEKGAAALLSLLPTTMESKMKKYGISRYEFEKLGE